MDVISVLSLSHTFRGIWMSQILGMHCWPSFLPVSDNTVSSVPFRPDKICCHRRCYGGRPPQTCRSPSGNMFSPIHALHFSYPKGLTDTFLLRLQDCKLSPRLPTQEWWSMEGTGDLKRTCGIEGLTWFDRGPQHGDASSSVLATVQVTWQQFNHLCSHCCSTPLVLTRGSIHGCSTY